MTAWHCWQHPPCCPFMPKVIWVTCSTAKRSGSQEGREGVRPVGEQSKRRRSEHTHILLGRRGIYSERREQCQACHALMPFGDTTKPHAFPGGVCYKRSRVQHLSLQHLRDEQNKTQAMGKGLAWRCVRAHSAARAFWRSCVSVSIAEAQGRVGCHRAIPTCVRASTTLMLPHLSLQCLYPSSCDASQYEDTQAR